MNTCSQCKHFHIDYTTMDGKFYVLKYWCIRTHQEHKVRIGIEMPCCEEVKNDK